MLSCTKYYYKTYILSFTLLCINLLVHGVLFCRYEETKLDLEEFQESSRELETELEAQLLQTETRNKELKALSSRLQLDCESLKVGFLQQCNL